MSYCNPCFTLLLKVMRRKWTKIETKNLLRNYTCDSCKWLQTGPWKKEYCSRQLDVKEKLPIPKSRTCEFWQDPNNKCLIIALNNKREVKDFFIKGEMFIFTQPGSIEGIEVYYVPTKQKIWEEKFVDGPYEFPDGGGSLKIDMNNMGSIVDQIVSGL